MSTSDASGASPFSSLRYNGEWDRVHVCLNEKRKKDGFDSTMSK